MCVQAWVPCPVWCVPQVQVICWGSWRDRNKDSFFTVRCSCWDGPWEWPMRQDTANKFRIKISMVLYWSWWTIRQAGLYCRNHQLLSHWIASCSLLSVRLVIPWLCPFRGAVLFERPGAATSFVFCCVQSLWVCPPFMWATRSKTLYKVIHLGGWIAGLLPFCI